MIYEVPTVSNLPDFYQQSTAGMIYGGNHCI